MLAQVAGNLLLKIILPILVTCLCMAFSAQAQYTQEKVAVAVRTEAHISIDGIFDEPDWENATDHRDFRQNNPLPGQPSSQPTTVKLLYDDNALYVAATMYEVSSDSIARQLSKRDNTENADIFAIYLDTYNDDLNAFQFMVTASGVQVDIRMSPAGDDIDWNAVWYSAVHIDDKNWYVEMKIPFSALRFPKSEVQEWGINFFREIRRFREQSYWNYIDPAIIGFVNQFGILHGIENVDADTRLFFSPYVSAYVENISDPAESGSITNTRFNGGMDIKYGINDAFTVDVTLIPDFGQVLPDNEVLNLSPFEVYFNERRQFFTEGTELFNKGEIFYSRRIGSQPIHYNSISAELEDGEEIIENPQETRLLNSTKISGRTKSGLGIGVLNSVTAGTYATIRDTEGLERRIRTNPFSNYNVFVLDQSLKNNSYVSLINTNVWREGEEYDANVTATEFRLMDKSTTYELKGIGAVSQKYGTVDGTDLGYRYFISAGKVSGNFQYTLLNQLETDRYDPNDLGFLASNNEMVSTAELRYNWYKPYSVFLRSWTTFNVNYFRLYNPSVFTGITGNLTHRMLLRGFLMVNLELTTNPIGWQDYFETRTFDRYYRAPRMYGVGGWISSDYSKVLALDADFYYKDFHENERREITYRIEPRWRISDRLFLIASANFQNGFDDIGFVSFGLNDEITFGRRDRRTVENLLTTRYSFSPTMDLFFRLRHYWSKAVYQEYYALGEDGNLLPSEYDFNHDVNFNVLNVDLAFTWVFTPGSELSIVWKNVINQTGSEIPENYFNNVESLADLPQLNSLSVKVLVFVDYLWLKKKHR